MFLHTSKLQWHSRSPCVSWTNLGSCLPCMLLVCPRCESMPFSWKLNERSLNWNRLNMQTRTVIEVWLTCSNSFSPVHRPCVWTLELLAHKICSVHRTRTLVAMHSQHFLKDTNPSESSLLPAVLSGWWWIFLCNSKDQLVCSYQICWWCGEVCLCQYMLIWRILISSEPG